MALKSTIVKAAIALSNIDAHVYGDFALTIACHPSETHERMMVRVLAFLLHVQSVNDDQLEFGKGISSDDEPALWRRDLTGSVEEWIDVGLPEERLLRRAAGRANAVTLYAYGGRAVDVWWTQNQRALAKLDKLSVYEVPVEASRALATLATQAGKKITLTATIQDEQIYIADENTAVTISLNTLQLARLHQAN